MPCYLLDVRGCFSLYRKWNISHLQLYRYRYHVSLCACAWMCEWVNCMCVCLYACVCSRHSSMCSYHSLVKAHILIETLMWFSSHARNILVSSLNISPPEKTAPPQTLLRRDCFLLSGSLPSFITAESIGARPDQEQPANKLNSDLWPSV